MVVDFFARHNFIHEKSYPRKSAESFSSASYFFDPLISHLYRY